MDDPSSMKQGQVIAKRGEDSVAAARTLPRSIRQKYDQWLRRRLWKMEIDPTAWISETAYVDRTWPRGIHIGADCVIGHEASILTHDMIRGVYLDTRIGQGTVIGARSIVMPGVKIGDNCLIEPGSVILSDLEAGAHVGGNPAKPVDAQAFRSATPGRALVLQQNA